MKIFNARLIHPLWAHIPAAAALVVLIISLIMAGPLPANAPIHFNSEGLPNGYGSPWLTFGLAIGLSLLYIVLSAAVDENWARSEKKKTFNWLSLFDDIIVGFLVGVSLGYLNYLDTGTATFSFPWGYIAATMGGALLLSLVLELLRPFRLYPRQLVSVDTEGFEKEVEQRLKSGDTFVYWQSQNPGWVSVITILLPLLVVAGAVYAWFSIPWVSAEMLPIAILIGLFNGGMRVMVTRKDITIRFGILGLKVKQIPLDEINDVEIHEFSGFRDFGGFGIRSNGRMTAYFLRGSRGVKVTTTRGKQYLIGSDSPEALYSVIKVLKNQTWPVLISG